MALNLIFLQYTFVRKPQAFTETISIQPCIETCHQLSTLETRKNFAIAPVLAPSSYRDRSISAYGAESWSTDFLLPTTEACNCMISQDRCVICRGQVMQVRNSMVSLDAALIWRRRAQSQRTTDRAASPRLTDESLKSKTEYHFSRKGPPRMACGPSGEWMSRPTNLLVQLLPIIVI